MNIKLLHKDAAPSETIARIHGILESVGLRRESLRIFWKKPWEYCHSCHIFFRDFPLLMANGKGLTEELTYASALAEYIERLQCRMDRLFRRAGNIHCLPRIFPARQRPAREIRAEMPAVFEQDLRGVPDLITEDFPCVPFVDVFGGRVVDLPYELLCSATGTNGMASGNTPAEALCHAICEVCERYVIRLLAEETLPGLPTIALDPQRISHPIIRSLVDEIRADGLEILVKDGSLGGVLPVLAVALIDRQAGTCAVSFGSDPVFEVALSRCLTEAVQGVEDVHRPLAAEPAGQRPLDFCNNPDVLLDRLTENVGTANPANAFIAATDNQTTLAFLLARIRGLDRPTYIHDASVLGFPSYYVYIQHLSPDSIPENNWNFLWRKQEEVTRTLFSLDICSREAMMRAANVLFEELTQADPLLEEAFWPQPLHAPVVWWVGIRPLLTAMLMEAGEFAKARTVLHWPRAGREAEAEAPDSPSVRVFRERLAACLAEDAGDIPAAPADIRDGSRPFPALARIMGQLRARGNDSGQAPWLRVEELPIPRCRDASACASCICRRYCFLDEWHRMALTVRAAARPPRSQALLDLLSALP